MSTNEVISREKYHSYKNLYIFTIYTDETKIDFLKFSSNLTGIRINYIFVEPSEWTGYKEKIFKLRKVYESLNDNDIICFVDAYDVIVNSNCEEILEKFLSFNKDLVIAAETNSYPKEYEEMYEITTSKFKFLNSGCYCGYKHSIMKLFFWKEDSCIEEICSYKGDQHYFIKYYLENYKNCSIVLDSNCLLFQCMIGVDLDDFIFENGRISESYSSSNKKINKPCFFHFNGRFCKNNLLYFLAQLMLSIHLE